MQSKHTLLAFILVSVVATEPITAAVERKSKVEKVRSTFQTFKKDILSIFSRKGCTRKQKVRLSRQGGLFLGATAVLASIYYGRKWSKGTGKPGGPDGRQEPPQQDLQYVEELDRVDAKQQAQHPIEPPQAKENLRKSPLERRLEEARRHLEKLREKQQQADNTFAERFGWKLTRAKELEPTWDNKQRAAKLRNDFYDLRREHESSASYLDLYNQIVAAVQAVQALENEIGEEPK